MSTVRVHRDATGANGDGGATGTDVGRGPAEAAVDDDASPGEDGTDDTAGSARPHRRIRSFVTRAGRISPAQQRARETLGPRYLIPFDGRPIDAAAVFGRVAPLVVEIGFGMGAATADVAVAHPELDFVGIEVHAPGVGALLKLIGERSLHNVRIVEHDAVDVIEQMVAPSSLAGVLVWFPDPWHKARHNKRRLIQPAFVAMLASRLRPHGLLHCATDWEEYALQMLDVLDGEPTLCNTSDAGFAAPATALVTRPTTKFETRGKRLGHGVWDVVFEKRPASSTSTADASR